MRDSILYVNVNIGMHLSESVSIWNPGNEASVSRGNRRKRLVALGDEGRSRDETRRDEVGAEEISGSETWRFPCTSLLFTHTHTCSPGIVKGGVLAAAFYFIFYFLTVYLGSAHWAQSQTDTPEVQRHLQKYFTGATRQV